MSRILIIGATSAMAEHTARVFATPDNHLLLAARNAQRLQAMAADLRIRGAAAVDVLPAFDAASREGMQPLLDALNDIPEPLDVILVAHGVLPDQAACEDDPAQAADALAVNFTSGVHLCTVLGNRLADQGSGTLAVISSVAGLRGRKSNYVYGAAKGGLNIFLQGLRNRLFSKGVRVITLLPGFVDTPMTAEIDKGPLFVSAGTSGRLIHRALTRGRRDVVYIPFFWRYILWVIRSIPETLFKRLSL